MSQPASNVIEADRRGWAGSRRSDVDRAVRSAGRHSTLVRVLRIGLPAGVIVGAVGFGLFTYFKPLRVLDALPHVSGKLAVQGSKITMELPRIAGFTRDKRAYELNAETAVQDIASPDIIEMLKLRARMEMQDKDVITVTANSGTYNTKGDSIVLRDQVVVTSEQGYKAQLREAAVQMKTGSVVSDQPVDITLPNGRLTANHLEVLESGETVRFGRGVVLMIDAEKRAGAAQ